MLRLLLVALLAALVATGFVTPITAHALSATALPTSSRLTSTMPCADVLFLTARGSGEQLGHEHSDDPAVTELGGKMHEVRDRFVQRMSGVHRRTVRQVFVDYDSADMAVLWADLSRASTTHDYLDSVADGERELRRVLDDSLSRCPNERWVVGGYSQGAMAVSRVLPDYADAARFDGVLLVANPDRNPTFLVGRELGTARGGGWGVGAVQDSRPSVPGDLVHVISSLCDDADAVCDTTTTFGNVFTSSSSLVLGASAVGQFGRGTTIHGAYDAARLRALADVAADRELRIPQLQPQVRVTIPPGVPFDGGRMLGSATTDSPLRWSLGSAAPGNGGDQEFRLDPDGTWTADLPQGRYVIPMLVQGVESDVVQRETLVLTVGSPPDDAPVARSERHWPTNLNRMLVGLGYDAAGRAYGIDSWTRTILRSYGTGGRSGVAGFLQWRTTSNEGLGLQPTAIAVTPDGIVYSSGAGIASPRIQRYAEGTDTDFDYAPRFHEDGRIAVDPVVGTIYVARGAGIERISANGRTRAPLTALGVRIDALTVNAAGDLYAVVDPNSDCWAYMQCRPFQLYRISEAGEPSLIAELPFTHTWVSSVAADTVGDVFVSNGQGTVWAYSGSGHVGEIWTAADGLPGATVYGPTALATDPQGDLHLAVQTGPSGDATVVDIGIAHALHPLGVEIGLVTASGEPRVGEVLSAWAGGIAPGDTRITWQWTRDGAGIPDATDVTYRLTAADRGHAVAVVATGSASGREPADVSSAVVGPVVGETITAGAVSLVGAAEVGHALRVDSGTWSPADVTLSYRWMRDGVPIPGATGDTCPLGEEDGGGVIAVEVVGARDGYESAVALSDSVSVPALPLRAAEPRIAGEARVGVPITAVWSQWGPEGVETVVQWLRDGVTIPGAAAARYTPTTADAGRALSVAVTGTLPGHAATTSRSVAVVVEAAEGVGTVPEAPVVGPSPHAAQPSAPAPPPVAVVASPPRSITAADPLVTGTPEVGEVLGATTAGWQPAGVVLARQWLRDGRPVSGATGARYLVREVDEGRRLSVRVTGTLSGSTDAVRTSPAVTVLRRFEGEDPQITGGARQGRTLRADVGRWTPVPRDIEFRWLRDGTPIAGATSTTYRSTRRDAGHRLRVRVRVGRPGFAGASATSDAIRIVR